MKKNLLIFGDSYGEEDMVAYPNLHPMYSEYRKLKSFHAYLRESNEFRSVKSFAVGGSDLWSQYEKFLKSYTGNEVVVWFVTHPGRIRTRSGSLLSNLSSCEHMLWEFEHGQYKSRNSDTQIQELKAAIGFYMYLYDEEKELFLHKKIMEAITKSINPNDCIIVDSFNTFNKTDAPSIGYAFGLENSVFVKSYNMADYYELVKTHHDVRRNHMTEANHKIFAEELLSHIKTGSKINYRRFVKPSPEDFDMYFKPITKE